LRDDFAFRSFTFQKDVSSAVVKLTSGFCYREAARGAIEQPCAELFFQAGFTAFETVAFDSRSSSAAPTKERVCTTFAKIARPSKSGRFDTRFAQPFFLPQDTAYCPAKNNIMSRSDGSQGTQLVQYEIVARQFSQIFCNMMRYLPEGTYVVCVDTVE
jgi:hypothetical protein